MPLNSNDIDRLVTSYREDYRPDVEGGLARLHARMTQRDPLIARRLRSRRVFLLSVAAAAMLLLVTGIFYFTGDGGHRLKTDGKQMAVHQLPDGSTITLQAGSEATYDAAGFNVEERRISLNGQAYFKVRPDASRPFLVNNGEMELRVTGTAFNLRSEEDVMEVEVSEGEVVLRQGKSKIRVAAKESGLSASGQPLLHKAAPNLNNHAWRTGDLKFERTPLSEVLSFMKSNWDIRCSWADGTACEYSVSGSYHEADAASVLADVAKLGRLTVTADANDPKHFIFTGPCAG